MPDNFINDERSDASADQPGGRDYAGPYFRRGRRCRSMRSPGSRLFMAIVLIVAGTLLFLDNIGVLPIHNIWDFWPVILIAVGVSKLTCRTASQRLWGTFLILFGALFLLLSLHVFVIRSWDRSWPISLLLIAFGFVALIRTIESGQAARPRVGFPGGPVALSGNFLDEHSVFGSVKRRLDTTNFSGGHIQCVFGSVEVDLRYVQLPPTEKAVTVDIDCIFGTAKIRVPDSWVLSIQAAAVLGNIEDKTIPGRAKAGVEPPVLIITGQSVFGTIEVEN